MVDVTVHNMNICYDHPVQTTKTRKEGRRALMRLLIFLHDCKFVEHLHMQPAGLCVTGFFESDLISLCMNEVIN